MSKIQRRRLGGKPLLVAGAGATVFIGGCIPFVGNLVAPPEVELCVTVSPVEADATVTINDVELSEDDLCMDVWDDSVSTVGATAVGYEDYSEEVLMEGDTIHDIVLIESD